MVAHAISNPRTVMVHLGHTHSAVRTVVTAFWLPLLALSAHFNLCVLRNCRNLLGSLEWCNPVAWKSHKDCEVKSKLKNSLIHLVFNPCIQLVVGEIQRTRIKKADKQPHAINKESVFHRPAAHWAEKLVAALTKSVHFRINSKNNAILIIRTAVCLFKILWINIVLLLLSIWNRFWGLNWKPNRLLWPLTLNAPEDVADLFLLTLFVNLHTLILLLFCQKCLFKRYKFICFFNLDWKLYLFNFVWIFVFLLQKS